MNRFKICALLAAAPLAFLSVPKVFQAWVANYKANPSAPYLDYVRALVVDPSGNAYTAGQTWLPASGFNYFIAKHSASGSFLWSRLGPMSSSGGPEAMQLDSQGNPVLVLNEDIGARTIKYDGDGVLLWESIAGGFGSDLVIDRENNVYVCGSGASLWKYDSAGNLIWKRDYIGSNGQSFAERLQIHDSSIYVVGTTYFLPYDGDILTLKWSRDGDLLWARTYSTPADSYDHGWTLHVDPKGDVFVGGSEGPGHGAVLKYDSSGILQWHVAEENVYGFVNSALDSRGHFTLVGDGISSNGFDFVTAQYDSLGNKVWKHVHDGTMHSNDYGRAIAAEPDGTVYSMGRSVDAQTGNNIVTYRFDPMGNVEWIAVYDEPSPDSIDEGICLSRGPRGTLYIAGSSDPLPGNNEQAILIKYDQNPRLK